MMKITFFSNFLNIHQLPFCEEVIRHIGEENFHFVATRGMDADRVQMGFEDMNQTKSFVVRAYEGETALEKAKQLAIESDVVIIGSAPDVFANLRLKEHKLTFRYNERLFKKGFFKLLDPRLFSAYYKRFTRYRNDNLYVLCASAYTKTDLKLLCFPEKKCFKWGYFPEMKQYRSFEELWEKKTRMKRQGVSILWVGRLIDWKHPEVAIQVAKSLKEKGRSFSLTMIGDGEERKRLDQLIAEYDLTDCVDLLGPKNHEFVLSAMEESDIFLFTSDRNEGWGAVLNEAMNAGCAVVGNKQIGSVPFLIQNGKNGFMYQSNQDLHNIMNTLCSSLEIRKELGQNAWLTMNDYWNASNAVNQLFVLIDSIQKGQNNTNIVVGPCSLA